MAPQLLAVVGLLAVLALGLRRVPTGYAGLVERGGGYRRTLRYRVGWVVPFLERTQRVDLRSCRLSMPAEPFRSKDQVQLLATVELQFQPVDPVLATYHVHNPRLGVEHLAVAELRAIIAEATARKLLARNAQVGETLAEQLARAENLWGVRIDQVVVSLRRFRAGSQVCRPRQSSDASATAVRRAAG
jgi:regulator of protease activity HflC (stomatin/prohibitin superfamily)